MNSSKPMILVMIFSTALAASALGQVPQDSGPITAGAVTLDPPKGGMLTMHLLDDIDDASVKGVPLCAAITTEHTQSFADGNRIHTSENSSLCRDSQGRTRRESALNLLGAGPQGSAPKLVTIVDPVAGVRYTLDPDNKIAHKMTLQAPGSLAAIPDGPPKGERVFYQKFGGPESTTPPSDVFFQKVVPDNDEHLPTIENLGDQTINGIRADGTRMTTTIPSGKLGNDKPISVTSERWYSSDLKATVMTKHNDPWAGELKTEFTSVNTSEPDPSLFTVPGDYRIVDDKSGPFRIQLNTPVTPAK